MIGKPSESYEVVAMVRRELNERPIDNSELRIPFEIIITFSFQRLILSTRVLTPLLLDHPRLSTIKSHHLASPRYSRHIGSLGRKHCD